MLLQKRLQGVANSVADLRWGAPGASPRTAHNVCNFMQFFGKFGQIRRLAPPPERSVSPHMGNPGSTPGINCIFVDLR